MAAGRSLPTSDPSQAMATEKLSCGSPRTPSCGCSLPRSPPSSRWAVTLWRCSFTWNTLAPRNQRTLPASRNLCLLCVHSLLRSPQARQKWTKFLAVAAVMRGGWVVIGVQFLVVLGLSKGRWETSPFHGLSITVAVTPAVHLPVDSDVSLGRKIWAAELEAKAVFLCPSLMLIKMPWAKN